MENLLSTLDMCVGWFYFGKESPCAAFLPCFRYSTHQAGVLPCPWTLRLILTTVNAASSSIIIQNLNRLVQEEYQECERKEREERRRARGRKETFGCGKVRVRTTEFPLVPRMCINGP